MQEIHRFSNDPVTVCGVFHWDVLRLFLRNQAGDHQGRAPVGGYRQPSASTPGAWTSASSTKTARLLEQPRPLPGRADGGHDRKELFETIPEHRSCTAAPASSSRELNTLFQLAALAAEPSRITLAQAETACCSCPTCSPTCSPGSSRPEYTEVYHHPAASTRRKPATGAFDLLERLGHSHPPVHRPSSTPGTVIRPAESDAICEELGVDPVKVPSSPVATHDTGSARWPPCLPQQDDFILHTAAAPGQFSAPWLARAGPERDRQDSTTWPTRAATAAG